MTKLSNEYHKDEAMTIRFSIISKDLLYRKNKRQRHDILVTFQTGKQNG